MDRLPLVAERFTSDLLFVLLVLFTADLLLELRAVVRSLDTSGRYTLTERLLTVDLPGREAFCNWRTFTRLPVAE